MHLQVIQKENNVLINSYDVFKYDKDKNCIEHMTI